MSTHVCITVRWVGDRFHGFIDGTESIEWPPSPFRLFQGLLASAHRHGMTEDRRQALAWLERQQNPPQLLAVANPATGVIFDHWVSDNDNLVTHRKGAIRKFKPVLHGDRPLVHYIWLIKSNDQPPLEALDNLTATLGWFGWAIDCAYATVTLASVEKFDSEKLSQDSLSRFQPLAKTIRTNCSLRVAKPGSTAELERLYTVNRIASSDQTQRHKRKWPKVFDRYIYSRVNTPPPRPYSIFKLVDDNDDTVSYSHAKLIHVTGMVRHAAIELMKQNPPRDLRGLSPEQWVDQYVAGHAPSGDLPGSQLHTQLSYIPLPSTGHEHTEPAVRRVMIVAPLGDEAWLDHLTSLLDGQLLVPLPGTTLPPGTHLQRIPDARRDGVRDAYTSESRTWASFTPVILPGHDDHKPGKTHKLILKALAQSGIDQPCEFEWSVFSRFPKSYGAQKYVPDETAPGGKRPVGYIRPDHLLRQTAVHLRLSFESPVPGPITIGAGRHCGLGLFARLGD